MTDAERRRLILLAEARGHANVAMAAIAKLVESLERVGHGTDLAIGVAAAEAVRVAKNVWTTLIDVRDRVDVEIGKVS